MLALCIFSLASFPSAVLAPLYDFENSFLTPRSTYEPISYNAACLFTIKLKHKEEIKELVDNNKFLLATGNAVELFGKYIEDDSEQLETLGIFDYYTKRTKNRVVSECMFKFNGINSEILGFQNNHGQIMHSNYPMFTVEKGFGNGENEKEEGYMQNKI